MSETGKRWKLRIPIRPDTADAVLFVTLPMTEGDWNQFHSVLDAMKPGMVAVEPETPRRLPRSIPLAE